MHDHDTCATSSTAPPRRGHHRSRAQPTRRRHDHPLWFLHPRARGPRGLLLRADALQLHLRVHRLVELQVRDRASSGSTTSSQLFSNGTLLNSLRITLVYAVLVAIFQNVFGLAPRRCCSRTGHPAQPRSPGGVLHPRHHVRARRRLHLPGPAEARGRTQRHPRLHHRAPTSTSPGSATPPGRSSSSRSIHAWKWMGLSMLIYLAGLKTINQDLLEAARLDGAGLVDRPSADPLPAARARGHLQRRDRAARLDERLRHRAGHHRAAVRAAPPSC